MLTEKEKEQLLMELANLEDSTHVHLIFFQMLMEIHRELVMIRDEAMSAPVDDTEPDPFQTLNGPSQ